MKTPLRRKILLYSSSVLTVLIITMLIYVSYQAERFIDDRIHGMLQDRRERIKAAEEDRLRGLKLTATMVASFPRFFAELGSVDTATVRDFLSDYRERTGTDLLIALDGAGRVVARTDSREPVPVLVGPDTRILKTDSGTYQVAIMPADTTGRVLGYVLAGILIDDKFARTLQGTGEEGVLIVGDGGILGSTLPRSTLPWNRQSEWEKNLGKDTAPRPIVVGGETYEAESTSLDSGGPLVAVMQSRDRAMQPYHSIQIGLLALGIIAIIGGVAGSAGLAQKITAPVAKLVEGTRQVAAGNFDYRLDIRSEDEIGDLAASFNVMTQGLRERADMQKFVSMSTVEMIHSAAERKVPAVEKVVLTILFSDMRGFTSMSENRPPEDTVRLLNGCLSLQAAKVKKYKGDIDKYVGDSVVALFTGEDMELNAIRCALETHRSLHERNAANPNEPPIQVGIGIVTGEVILGSIGSEDRLDYTVIGSNVNLCSRLCSHAGPGETLLAESTYTAVQGLVAAEKIVPIKVKGFTDPIPVYKM